MYVLPCYHDVCTHVLSGPLDDFQAEVLITTPFHPGYLTRDLVEKVRHLPYTQYNLIRELAELTCTANDPAGEESQVMYHRRCRLRPHRSQRCCRSQDPGIGGTPR